MRKVMCILLLIITCIYSVFRWDYHLSSYFFERVCRDPEIVGLFIYERVELNSDYIETVSARKIATSVDPHLIVNGSSQLDTRRFGKDFIYNRYEHFPFSKIGPIQIVQSSVIRVRDRKILGKSVSASNGGGWFAQWGVTGGGVGCPLGADAATKHQHWEYNHKILIRSIFSKK